MGTDASHGIDFNPLTKYYDSWESRIGYRLLLGGTRHFGYYEANTIWPFPLSSAMREMERLLLNLLDQPKGASVLDAGCGNGHVAMFMASAGLKITAIDLMDRHVARAGKEASRRGLTQLVKVAKMNYQDLTFADASFDAVYSVEALAHATDFQRAIAEFRRVLKPGGRLVLLDYEHNAVDGPAQQAVAHVNKLASMPGFQQSYDGFHKSELEKSGFLEVEHQDLTDNTLPMLRLFYVLAYIPYLIISMLGLRDRFPNAAAAVEFYRYRKNIRYVMVRGQMPRKA